MGFFLAEVSMLEIKDREMVENICNLVINGGLEEERDGHTPGPADGSMKAFSLNADALRLHHSSLYLIAARTFREQCDHYLHADYSEIVSPPPEAVGA